MDVIDRQPVLFMVSPSIETLTECPGGYILPIRSRCHAQRRHRTDIGGSKDCMTDGGSQMAGGISDFYSFGVN
jgi:hypothetical protein